MTGGGAVRRRSLGTAAGLAALLAAALLGGCASDAPKPTPLEAVEVKIAGRQVWSLKTAGFAAGQAVAVTGKRLVIASSDGSIRFVEAESGRVIGEAQAGGRLATGVGSDGRFHAVVTRDGDLVVLEEGALRWKQHLGTAVVTAPLVAGERVFVLGVDRSVQAWDVLDGKLLWNFTRAGDALTLSQAGVLAAYKDTLLVGQGNRLTALDPLKGLVRWEVPVATPRGTNEVERLADLIGPASRVGAVFCLRAFQNGVGCVDADRATTVWSINGGGGQPVAADDDYVFSADGVDRITARRRSNGETVWASDRFQHRRLSGPVSAGTTVAFGDFEGYVHFLARDTGTTLLRLPTDGSAVVGTPVKAGTTLVVTTRDGGVFAFRPE